MYVGGGHVTELMDDRGRASSGVPHTVTKGFQSSTGLNKEDVAMRQQEMGGDEKEIKDCLKEFPSITWIKS